MSNLSDVIGGQHLFNGSNYFFVNDRFENEKEAIFFNNGFLQAPAAHYFVADFTITAWINIQSVKSWPRILDFGNGKPLNNIVFALYVEEMLLSIASYDQTDYIIINSPKNRILPFKWYHVAFVLKGTQGIIYINGYKFTNDNIYSSKNETTLYNYIGKSWYDKDDYADAIYDDLKIYKGALSAQLVNNEYLKTRPGYYIL